MPSTPAPRPRDPDTSRATPQAGGRREPRDPEFEAKVRSSFGRQGIMGHLGARLEKVEPGRVEISLPFTPHLTQQHGYFHAGVVATIADSAGGYAAFSLFPPDSTVLAVELTVNRPAPADGERLLAVGEVVRSGRTITVCQLSCKVLKQGTWTDCMVGLQTNICLPGKADRPAG